MWKLKKPKPAKLIMGVLAADDNALHAAMNAIIARFGRTDIVSDIWPFKHTDYYQDQTGDNILKQFASFEKLISPGKLADIKLATNRIEQRLAKKLALDVNRPVNLDPGIIEPSKLILATTKDFSHRIYIGKKMYAEVTLLYQKGVWRSFEYTFPDHKEQCYHDFFTKVRTKLMEQLKAR